MKKTLHFRHGLAAMTATIVMLFAQLMATNAHASGISPATAGDETSSYGINIIGVPVTSENCNDLSVIDGVSGAVDYDPSTNTLTLNNATIDASKGRNAILHGIPNLTILLKGSNNIKGAMAALEATASTTIKGAGSLNITSPNECGIYIVRSTLTIEDCTVDITARWGIAGPNGNNPRENVVIRGATVSAQGSDGSICDINNLTLDRVAILSPTDAAFDSELKGVALNGTVVTDKVTIGVKKYGLYIAGVDITSANYDKINTIEGVSGTVDYDPETNTLTLNNATIEAGTGNRDNAIYNRIANLTIQVMGTNNITNDGAGIAIANSTTIKGDGTLYATGADNCGIYLNNSALTIEDCTVNTIGNWGIAGQSGATNETVTIRNATVTAQGKDGSICDIANLTLDDVVITSPEGAAFSSSRNCVALNGTKVTDKVVIMPLNCGLKIAGTYVTPNNCNDLSVIEGVSGTVKYDPLTRTLTLKNAKINLSGQPAIHNTNVSDLTIKVIGTGNTITVGDKAGIAFTKSTKIKGYSGSILKITSENDCGIYMNYSPLTIEDCEVNTKGKYGIAGYNGSDREILTIRSANVVAEGGLGSICDIKDLVLGQGCSISSPAGAAYDSSWKGVALNGALVKDEVTISVKSYRFDIVGVKITSDNYNRINTIEGVSGTVNYNPATNTLTLENATIQANDENDIAIFSSSQNLTILVTGTNYIKSPHNGLHILEQTTIKGEGTLNIECTDVAINTLAPNLTIEDCTVNAIGNYSISGRINNTNILNSLTIQNAIVKAESDWGSIVNIRELTLSGSTFTSPATATFNKSKKTVVDNGVTVKNLVIQPTTLYDVVLDWYGVNRIRVIKVLTDKYGYSLSKAKNIVENTPSIAGTGMHKLDAIEMRDALTAAGGIHSSATIHPEGTWTSINSTETVVPTHRPGIYNMQGVKMTRDWEALPSGLYIVDGVKRMKK